MKIYTRLVQILLIGWLCFAGCKQVDPVPLSLPTETVEVQPLPEPSLTPSFDPQESARLTLATLQKVGDYPLYTMQYYGDYEEVSDAVQANLPGGTPAWGCSLFAALGDTQSSLFGRNFDWTYSPAMMLQYHPTGGYASITMVDLAYLVDEADYDRLTELTFEQLEALLYAPSIPFDGMNEAGMAIGMAAVPPGNVPEDPNLPTISSLGVMREVLDHAATVEEAVAIFQRYNIDFSGGPGVHYLIADKTGASALVEFSDGEVVVIENEQPWHLTTNFIVDQHSENPEGQCVRYRTISDKLEETGGVLTVEDALKLLWQVSQSGSTQWSAVYDLSRAEVHVVMGMEYEEVFRYPVMGDITIPILSTMTASPSPSVAPTITALPIPSETPYPTSTLPPGCGTINFDSAGTQTLDGPSILLQGTVILCNHGEIFDESFNVVPLREALLDLDSGVFDIETADIGFGVGGTMGFYYLADVNNSQSTSWSWNAIDDIHAPQPTYDQCKDLENLFNNDNEPEYVCVITNGGHTARVKVEEYDPVQRVPSFLISFITWDD